MKKALIALALVGAAALAWILLRAPAERAAPPGTRAAAASVEPKPATGKVRPDPAPMPKPPPRVKKRGKVDRAERDAVHKRILEGLARRHANRVSDAAPLDERPASRDNGDEERPPSTIKNRLGDDPWSQLVTDLLGNDFGPLADECFEEAHARLPDLHGMADIEFTIVADEDIGGVVEEAGPGKGNEIQDATFVECMRETALSTIFPPPEDSGRRKIRLTMPFEPE